LTKDLIALGPVQRERLNDALALWLEGELAPLAPLRRIEEACRDPAAGSEVRALLLQLVAGAGMVPRERAGLVHVPKERRQLLRRLGVTIGALDIFVPALLKPSPRRLFHAIGTDRRRLQEDMAAVVTGVEALASGYRPAGKQAIRIDMAEKLFRAAHEGRAPASSKQFRVATELATSMGLTEDSYMRLMRDAGFRLLPQRKLAESAHGPPAPSLWEWRATRKDHARAKQVDRNPLGRAKRPHRERSGHADPQPREGNVFAQLADLMR
jgi:ATP-dependent RNA helicase SUPV3L1/SUV3